jgi:DNA-binding transcriptional regulator YhcF (GntR family)
MSTTVTIDPESTTPPYEQLRRQLAYQIRSGALSVDDRLPTVRQLASDLGLAKNTIVRAFRELEQSGLVAGAGRRGTIVLARGDGPADRQMLLNEAASRLYSEVASLRPTLEEVVSAIKTTMAAANHDAADSPTQA